MLVDVNKNDRYLSCLKCHDVVLVDIEKYEQADQQPYICPKCQNIITIETKKPNAKTKKKKKK